MFSKSRYTNLIIQQDAGEEMYPQGENSTISTSPPQSGSRDSLTNHQLH